MKLQSESDPFAQPEAAQKNQKQFQVSADQPADQTDHSEAGQRQHQQKLKPNQREKGQNGGGAKNVRQ